MKIETYIKKIINGGTGFKVCERIEGMIHHIDRETSIADWVIRCLANIDCEGSEDVLKEIMERRSSKSFDRSFSTSEKEYANDRCRQQRLLCADAADKCKGSKVAIMVAVINAEMPKFD